MVAYLRCLDNALLLQVVDRNDDTLIKTFTHFKVTINKQLNLK